MLNLFWHGWAAYSFLATCFGLSGIALVAAALFLGAYLPGFVKTLMFVAGAVVLAFAGGLQAGQMRGAHAAYVEDTARAVAAEKLRTALAEKVATEIADQATKDLADAQADAQKLKELNDVLKAMPQGGCPALRRDTARRLRNL